MYTYICIYVHIYMYICMYVCVRACVRVCVYIYSWDIMIESSFRLVSHNTTHIAQIYHFETI